MKNFKHLYELIDSGIKNIVLDSDIILDENEESKYLNGIELDTDGVVIDGNGHSIDACGKTRIFNCRAKNITIKNIILKNGFSTENGAAIYNLGGTLTITQSRITDNISKQGGTICNEGELVIKESDLRENTSQNSAVIYNEGELTLKESKIEENTSRNGETILNNGYLNMVKCEISYNESLKNIITNSEYLEIHYSDFKKNKAEYLLVNDKNAFNLSIFYGEFKDNCVEKSVVFNIGKSCRIEKSIFRNNNLKNIHNQGNLTFRSPDFKDSEKTVFNEGKIYIKESYSYTIELDYLSKIHGEGIVKTNVIPGDRRYNFEYLDKLIHESYGNNEFELNDDICLQDHEIDFYKEGIDLDIDGLTIDGKGKTIDGAGECRIFTVTGNNITLKNITFRNGYSHRKYKNSEKSNGGAIQVNSNIRLNIENCKFINNYSEENGGAIDNKGELKIIKSTFTHNSADNLGGVIYNRGELTISDESTLTENRTVNGGTIHNIGNLKIFNSEISSNESTDCIIDNEDYLETQNSRFHDNKAKNIIMNENGSNSGIFYGEFFNNNIGESVISNNGDSCIIEKGKFKNNNSKNIINQSNLILKSPKIMDVGKTVLNEGKIYLKELEQDIIDDYLGKIHGKGIIKTKMIPEEEKFDFGYLDNEIHKSKTKEIVLSQDICLEEYEEDFYEGGIELDIDGLIIDGAGHNIDGAGKSRIFTITGDNVVLKNITFKNGYSHKSYDNPINNHGGAIKVNHDKRLTVKKCEFINNTSSGNGGAIHKNKGILRIFKSVFNGNTAHNGGAIFNRLDTDLTIDESEFNRNEAHNGGAIKQNKGTLTMTDSKLNRNTANTSGGAINGNTVSITIKGCELIENTALEYGGAINNLGKVEIFESTLNKNATTHNGGAIKNLDELTITKSMLTENVANYGGAIHNNRGTLTVKFSKINRNTANTSGGAIYKYDNELIISDSTLNENKTENGSGGAIFNDKSRITLKESALNNNSSTRSGGAIYNYYGILKMINSLLCENSADYAGAIHNDEGMLIMEESTLNENTALNEGGAIYNNYGQLTMTNSTLNKNMSSQNGGAIWCEYKEQLKFDNCNLTGNEPNDVYYR